MAVLNPVYQSAYDLGSATTVISVGTSAITTPSSEVTAGTASCMDCIRGETSASKQTVWCSGGWNYEYKVLPLADPYPIAN